MLFMYSSEAQEKKKRENFPCFTKLEKLTNEQSPYSES